MKKSIAVVYGGRSGEHEISIRSAKSILAALDREKYEIFHSAGSAHPVLSERGHSHIVLNRGRHAQRLLQQLSQGNILPALQIRCEQHHARLGIRNTGGSRSHRQ